MAKANRKWPYRIELVTAQKESIFIGYASKFGSHKMTKNGGAWTDGAARRATQIAKHLPSTWKVLIKQRDFTESNRKGHAKITATVAINGRLAPEEFYVKVVEVDKQAIRRAAHAKQKAKIKRRERWQKLGRNGIKHA